MLRVPCKHNALHVYSIQRQSQEGRILDLVSSSLELLNIPVGPNKLALEEFSLRRSEPDSELTAKLSCGTL